MNLDTIFVLNEKRRKERTRMRFLQRLHICFCYVLFGELFTPEHVVLRGDLVLIRYANKSKIIWRLLKTIRLAFMY